MKLTSVCLACAASLALTGSALAWEAQGPYLHLGLGWDALDKTNIDFSGATVGLKASDGIKLVAGSGYRFTNGLRVEAEFNYSYHDMGSGYDGYQEMRGGFVNALYDYKLDPKWTLSLGAGVGFGSAYIKAIGDDKSYVVETSSTSGSVTTTTDTTYDYQERIHGGKATFQWQMIAEASYALSHQVEAYVDYRYRQVQTNGAKIGSQYYASESGFMTRGSMHSVSDNSIMVGFRYFLNSPPPAEPAAPPPAAPPPPPPPPPPPVTTYMVFFDFGKSDLSDAAKHIIAKAVMTAKDHGFVKVKVVGHTDTVGSKSFNMKLSKIRAAAVKAEMLKDGMPTDAIEVQGVGFSDPLVPTGKGVKEPQNRRAVIDLGK